MLAIKIANHYSNVITLFAFISVRSISRVTDVVLAYGSVDVVVKVVVDLIGNIIMNC